VYKSRAAPYSFSRFLCKSSSEALLVAPANELADKELHKGEDFAAQFKSDPHTIEKNLHKKKGEDLVKEGSSHTEAATDQGDALGLYNFRR